ncbi:MAG: hypothetical protein ACYSR0_09580 [Planctomycetota bacterium]
MVSAKSRALANLSSEIARTIKGFFREMTASIEILFYSYCCSALAGSG